MTTPSAGFGSYKPLAVPKPSVHHHTSLFGEIEGGITGFIGHLGNDVVTSVMGIPMGITMLLKHPIQSIEGIGKATWHDWSPVYRADMALLHGDVGGYLHQSSIFYHQFYEHPLAPILDVLGAVTFGVGTAARGADALATLGVISKTGKLAEFGNLTKVVTAGHRADYLAANPGASSAEVDSAVQTLLSKDPKIRRIATRPSGQTVTRDWSHNPLIRARQQYVASVGEKLANSPRLAGLHLDEVWGTGDQAFAKRWIHMNRGQRAAAAVVQTVRELGTVHALAEKINSLGEFGALNHIMKAIRKAMEVHAIRIEWAKADTEVGKAGLKADRMTYLKALEHLPGQELIGPEMDKAFAKGGVSQALKTVGVDHTTNDINQAATEMVNGVKHVLVVRGKDDIGRITTEARNSMKVANAILTKPVAVWKWMILAASPRYFVNNVIGNSFMLMMMANPVTTSLAMFHHIATTRGINKANAAWEEVTRATAGSERLVEHILTPDFTPDPGGLFHGTRKRFEGDVPGDIYSTGSGAGNLYGHGFYTTDSHDIASTYTRKGGATEKQHVYGVRWTGEGKPNLLDLDKSVHPTVKAWGQAQLKESDAGYFDVSVESYDALKKALETGTSGEVIRAVRKMWGSTGEIPKSEVDHMVSGLSDQLATQGYDGFRHVGGNLAGGGKKLHNVTIFFDTKKLKLSDATRPKPVRVVERVSIDPADVERKIALRRARREVSGQGPVNQLLADEHMGMAQSEQHDIANLGQGGEHKQTLTGKAAHKAGVGKVYEHTRQGLYPITHRYSDTLHRSVAFHIAVTRTPEYQMFLTEYMKRHHISRFNIREYRKARDYATKRALRSESVRSYVREQANHTLGQYHTFYSWERTVRKFVPFYSWDRAITRHTAEMVKERPYQAAILATVGQRGVQETKDMLGQLPDFLQGVIPTKALSAGAGPLGLLGLLTGNAKGREGVIETQGINPYATIGDLVKTGESVVGLGSGQGVTMGSTLGGQLNPLLQGAIEGISGTSLLTGGPVSQQPGGLIGDVYGGTFSNVPIINVLKLAAQKEGFLGGYAHQSPNATHPLLFKKDLRSGLSSLLGAPTRQVNRETAAELYLTEHHKKKKASGDAPLLPIRGSSSFGGNMPGF